MVEVGCCMLGRRGGVLLGKGREGRPEQREGLPLDLCEFGVLLQCLLKLRNAERLSRVSIMLGHGPDLLL